MAETTIGDTAVRVVMGDITACDVDVIVNAANSSLLGGGGVDGAIHRAAGSDLLNECRLIGGCSTGDAVITGAGRLPARHVIHTVGPVWRDHTAEDADGLLASCYRGSLQLAADAGCTTIAFPNISTGIYGYPLDRAASVAIAAVREFLERDTRLVEVTFVCFNSENHDLYATELS